MKTAQKMLFSSKRFTNRMLWEVLPDNSWRGKPCFIVGGGPSLERFNWELLRGHRTIGVNRAFERFDPTIIFSMDTRFLNWLRNLMYDKLPDGNGALEKFNTSKAYRVWMATYTLSLPAEPEFFIVRVKCNYSHGLKAFTFSMVEGIGHGDNSGYAALNLAVCLGANPIYLLGFDLDHDVRTGRSHWHSGHPIEQRRKTVREFIPYFERAAMLLRGTGFQVVNLNPHSALRCFPMQPAEEVLH